MRKDRILLVWQYSRKDWIENFEKLSADFDFVFLAEVFSEQVTDNVSHFADVIYWSNYNGANSLLNSIKPQKIIFMGLESLHTIALNYAAISSNIQTFYLQHGIYAPLKSYVNEEQNSRKLNVTSSFKTKPLLLFMIRFYLSSVGFNSKLIIYLFKYILYKNKMTKTEFLIRNPMDYRVASNYIVFTKKNALFLSERDGFEAERYIEIGNPVLDKYYFKKYDAENYILLIDTTLVEVKTEGMTEIRFVSADDMNNFYSLINQYAIKHDLRLKIKLHPYSYESSFYLKHENIDYIRDCDLPDLIDKSKCVISFLSTLTMPAILKKPFLLIRTMPDEQLLNDFEKWGMPNFPSLHTFTSSDIKFAKLSDFENIQEDFYKEYIYKFDGQSLQRLKAILIE